MYSVIHRTEFYSVESVVRPSNNWSLEAIAVIDVAFQHPIQQFV